MSDIAAQVTLLARSDDVEKWMNILIVVVLAAFWAIANLVRAKKVQSQDEQEQQTHRPAQKPPAAAKPSRQALWQQRGRFPARPAPGERYHPQARPPASTVMQPKPIAQEPGPKMKRPAKTPAAALEEPKLPALTAPLESGLEELPEFIAKPVEGLEPEYGATATETGWQEPAIEGLLDYDDPTELRRAILHYEILGKPLSLRRPGEQIIGL